MILSFSSIKTNEIHNFDNPDIVVMGHYSKACIKQLVVHRGMLAWVLVVIGFGLVVFVATGGYPCSWVHGWGVEAWG